MPNHSEVIDDAPARGSRTNDEAAWLHHGFSGDPTALLNGQSLPRVWQTLWTKTPNAPVLLQGSDVRNGTDSKTSNSPRWITMMQLAERTARVASSFYGAGVRPGDRILMSCAPCVELIIAHVAALRMGAVVVPVNTDYGDVELQRIIAQARPSLAVLDDPSRVSEIPACTAAVELPISQDTPTLDTMRADDPALLMFTSGTTGQPKGVVLTHGNILASAQALVTAWRWTASDQLILALPLFHMHGLGVGIHGTLLAGASAIVLPRFDVDTVLNLCTHSDSATPGASPTMFFGVPTMWVRLAASHRARVLSSLRLCVSGSAALSPDTWNALAIDGHQQILERYGMTETIMNISNPFSGERRAGTVGLPLPGVEVRVRGTEGPGEILLRGPNVMRAYWENDAATTDAFTRDGWFKTGDLGEFDSNGYIRIVGRSKDLIISGGFNVYPREIEEAILTHASVLEASVAGMPHPEFGETVVAYLVTSSDISDTEVHAHLLPLLAKYKRPRHIVFVDALPKNALGKTQKHLLPVPML
jgi:malonyl-CoA/methylmalonyl-CoA synthetase